MNSGEREVSKIYHTSWILPILDFVTDAKLNYSTTKVWKRVWILEARSENGWGKWNILVWNLAGQDLGTGRHTPTKNSEGNPPRGLQLENVNLTVSSLSLWVGNISKKHRFALPWRIPWFLRYIKDWLCLCLLLSYQKVRGWSIFHSNHVISMRLGHGLRLVEMVILTLKFPW